MRRGMPGQKREHRRDARTAKRCWRLDEFNSHLNFGTLVRVSRVVTSIQPLPDSLVNDSIGRSAIAVDRTNRQQRSIFINRNQADVLSSGVV